MVTLGKTHCTLESLILEFCILTVTVLEVLYNSIQSPASPSSSTIPLELLETASFILIYCRSGLGGLLSLTLAEPGVESVMVWKAPVPLGYLPYEISALRAGMVRLESTDESALRKPKLHP